MFRAFARVSFRAAKIVSCNKKKKIMVYDQNYHNCSTLVLIPDRKVDIKDNHLSIKLIPMISTWDQVDPIFPVRRGFKCTDFPWLL
jgi:hypothetical protein